ncbi:MAG: cupin domain-containing protein [Pseudomonadota bacterium]
MDHFRAGSRPTKYGPSEYFRGTVTQDPIVEAPEPARIRAIRVSFLPGGCTNWHTHPLGQTLHVVSGTGRFQTWGEPVVEIKAGDSIWIPPGEKHWHGAAPETAMVHIAFQEALDGKHIEWMEPVSDEDYHAAPG